MGGAPNQGGSLPSLLFDYTTSINPFPAVGILEGGADSDEAERESFADLGG